jgi:hypothetical protein
MGLEKNLPSSRCGVREILPVHEIEGRESFGKESSRANLFPPFSSWHPLFALNVLRCFGGRGTKLAIPSRRGQNKGRCRAKTARVGSQDKILSWRSGEGAQKLSRCSLFSRPQVEGPTVGVDP